MIFLQYEVTPLGVWVESGGIAASPEFLFNFWISQCVF